MKVITATLCSIIIFFNTLAVHENQFHDTTNQKEKAPISTSFTHNKELCCLNLHNLFLQLNGCKKIAEERAAIKKALAQERLGCSKPLPPILQPRNAQPGYQKPR